MPTSPSIATPSRGATAPTRILLADDHALVRRGVRLILDGEPDLTVVAEAYDGAEAIEMARAERPDLVILDIAMPRLTGLQAARELSRVMPGLRILMLTMYDNEQYFFEALKAGAAGYVLKSVADRDLVEACRAAMRDEPFLYPGAVTALIRNFLDRAKDGEDLPSAGHHGARGGDPQAGRRGPLLEGDRRAARHQRQDRGAAPRQPAPEARPARPPGAHPLRDPCRADRTLTPRGRGRGRGQFM